MSEGPWPTAVKPISPIEAAKNKILTIPSFVLEAVNTLLTKKFVDGREIILKQEEIIIEAEKIGMSNNTIPPEATRQTFFSDGWLNFEALYQEEGWEVKYDKPDYTESWDPYFTFKASIKK